MLKEILKTILREPTRSIRYIRYRIIMLINGILQRYGIERVFRNDLVGLKKPISITKNVSNVLITLSIITYLNALM